MDTNSFVYEIDNEHFCKDIAKGVETCFYRSRYLKDANRPITILIKNNKELIA